MWLQRAREPLPFTPLHRHEFRNAFRLRVFRGEITPEQRKLAFLEIESDRVASKPGKSELERRASHA
jgi:hypothetical protein